MKALPAISIALLLLFSPAGRGAEKFSIAKSADLIVIGRLHAMRFKPDDGGWGATGNLAVSRWVLGGPQARQVIKYYFACSCCVSDASDDFKRMIANEGIWFLVRDKQDQFRPAGSCQDPGFRPMRELAVFERYIKRYR